MSAISVDSSVAGESFGRRLRRERERRQIALASIAENTKISGSLFADLERDDVSRWPSGIFRRSFIRAYAAAIGLDPDETTHEFLERFPDANDPDLAATPPRHPRTALRLTLADSRTWFLRGRILPSWMGRSAAVTIDATVIATLGLATYAVVGTIWMPLSIAAIGYYVGGILLFGNTPGVCLCAPTEVPKDPPSQLDGGHRVRVWAASFIPSLGQKPRETARAEAD